MGQLMTGLVFVEVVFAYPGVGTLAFESIQRRDILLMDGILLISAVWIVLMNLAADLLLKRLDPRVREEAGR
jgi:peptide/nickel transport system permease protein